jgi:xanthine dehydrogenase YagT iron-sulfur-binding subunit
MDASFSSPRPSSDEEPCGSPIDSGPTRRQFIGQVTTAGVSMAVVPGLLQSHAIAAEPASNATAEEIEVSLKVNGQPKTLKIDPRVTLLDALRERLGLTGSKKGCDRGQCGACTVLVNSRRINSCLSLAAVHDGDEITTIEGLADGDGLHPMQAAFIHCDGFQCGYCTPGQIMSAVALMKEGCPKDDAGIREKMSGNICRCGAYQGILEAIREVRDQKKPS